MELDVNLRRILAILVHRAWLLVLSAALFGAVAFAVCLQMPRTYEASTTVLIDEAPSTNGSAAYQSILTSERRAQTYSELLVANPLLDVVIQKLALPSDIVSLRKQVMVDVVPNTQLIKLQVRDTDARRAAQIANTLVTLFAEREQQRQAARYGASKDSLSQQMAVLDKQVKQTQASLSVLGSKPEDKAARDRLENSLAQYRQSYASLLQSYEQIRVAEAQTNSSVSQEEPAVVPSQQVSPRVVLVSALAAIVGLLLALAIVFLREALDDSIKEPEELSQRFGLPILGIVSHMPKADDTQPVAVAQPRSPVAEAYRVLRTNIQYTSVDRPLRTLLVTSPSQGEGKSTTVANLSTVLAQEGREVVVVDADLRRPTLHKRFEIANRMGLTDLLAQSDVDLDGSVRATSAKGVAIITAGATPPNPAELVGSARMGEILKRVQDHADVVIIDAPPITPVTDAVVLAQRVDGVLLVVRAGVTKRGALNHSIEQLRHVGTNVIGVVINDIPVGRSRYGYAYRGYYRNYTYDQDNESGTSRSGVRAWFRRRSRAEQEVDLQP